MSDLATSNQQLETRTSQVFRSHYNSQVKREFLGCRLIRCVMKNYKDLEVYQEAKNLAIEVHIQSISFPKFELYEEGSQIRRSSKAIAALIAEGYGRRRYKAEFIKYLIYALAECDETMVHLDFLNKTGSMKLEKYSELSERYDELGKRLNTFTQWVIKKFVA
jgi:four helix bundle protein